MPDESDSSQLHALLETGAEIAGASAGALIGLEGGPLFALAGAASGPLVARGVLRMASEIRSRVLGHREEVRIGAALTYFIEAVEQRIDNGDHLRTDGFFSRGQTERSSGEQILEATLLAAQREPEEAKLRYMGRLLANLAFDEDLDVWQANVLVRTAERLSYRQLLLLQFFLVPGAVARDTDFRGQGGRTPGEVILPNPLLYLLDETYDLYRQGLINIGGIAAQGATDLVPSLIETQGIGRNLVFLMGLNNVEDASALNSLSKLWMSAPRQDPPPD